MLDAPSTVRDKFANDDFAAGYINFYVCNGAVIAPKFGDKRADFAAKQTLQRLFPKRKIVQVNIDGIAAGGGRHPLHHAARANGLTSQSTGQLSAALISNARCAAQNHESLWEAARS